jgi:hypothetical protein
MQRTITLLQKINALLSKEADATAIDVDLALDYTRVLYADLLEWRSRVSFNQSLMPDVLIVPQSEPIQQEITDGTGADVSLSQDSIPTQPITDAENDLNAILTEPQSADIRKWIGINDKYQFISELFGNDKNAYEIVISELNTMSDYDKAVEWLDEAHTSYNWNDEDITVQSFYSVVNQFFSER